MIKKLTVDYGNMVVTEDDVITYETISKSDAQTFADDFGVTLNDKHFEYIYKSLSNMEYLPHADSEELRQIVEWAINEVENEK